MWDSGELQRPILHKGHRDMKCPKLPLEDISEPRIVQMSLIMRILKLRDFVVDGVDQVT